MWYAVLRKRERGVFIGALAIRHGEHHASLLQGGWEEIPLEELRARPLARRSGDVDGRADGVWSYRSITSGTAMRTQPCEAAEPSELIESVPWMPAPA